MKKIVYSCFSRKSDKNNLTGMIIPQVNMVTGHSSESTYPIRICTFKGHHFITDSTLLSLIYRYQFFDNLTSLLHLWS